KPVSTLGSRPRASFFGIMLQADIYSAGRLGNVRRRRGQCSIRRSRPKQSQLGLPGGRGFTVQPTKAENTDAFSLLRLHHDDRDSMLATLRQIGVLRNGDIERLAEGNAIGAQHKNGFAVSHIFIGRRATRNKSGRRQSRPAWFGALLVGALLGRSG